MELEDEYPERKIRVVDSLCASLGQGLFLDYIIKYLNTGASIDDVARYADDLKLSICHEFTVDDLFHLKRGGRVSATSAIFGTILSIKPVLHVDDNGKLVAVHKVRGRKSSIRKLYEIFEANNCIEDNEPIFISHGNCYEEVLKLVEMIKEIKPNNEIYINYIGPIIGAHAGQGTIALFYRGKTRKQ